MPLESPIKLAPAFEMTSGKGKISAAQKIFDAMRQKLREVFPDDDEVAWQWTGEDFEDHQINRPGSDFKSWLSKQYEGSDDFTQRFVRRMFTIWDVMEHGGFRANNRELYEHQKALFAWIAIKIATGTRGQVANLLVRSPYGSGKSLVAGLVVRAFREAQEELLIEGMANNQIPTGILLGLRKEHMLQNALGTQFAVLQPPYTVERQDVAVYWKNLSTMFGEDFSESFPRPGGKKHPFYNLFITAEDDEESGTSDRRLQAYLADRNIDQKTRWESVPGKRRGEITSLLQSLMDGQVILISDVYNVPQAEKPVPREQHVQEDSRRYGGDSAYALSENSTYQVKATHRHLALNKGSYTTKPDMEHPAQFCIAYGSTVTRRAENIRADVREEIMRRTGLIVVDEVGSYTPQSLGDSASELSGKWPRMVGFTGQDRGIDGWDRSPVLSIEKMCELGLMKPIAFQGLGDAESPPAQGTEEAWDAYRKEMFKNVRTATNLKLLQPYELDTVVIAPPSNVREYAHRILKAHEEEDIPVKVWCFDPAAGDNRWSTVVSGFNAPKNPGDPRRILVAPPSQMVGALHLHAECYDILANMNSFSLDQTRGRLGHIRNNERTELARRKARTYFRVQWLEDARGEPYIREVAKMMGFELDDEHQKWRPLHNMIDTSAYNDDEERKGLSEPVPIPDAAAVAKRKRRGKGKIEWTPLRSTSPFVIERDRKKEERRQEQQPRFSDARSHHPQSVAKSGSAPAPAQRPAVSVVRPAENRYAVSKGNISITIVTGKNGMPTNLRDLANQSGLPEYSGALEVASNNAYRKGLRGRDLASAILDKLIHLGETVMRRATLTSVDNNGRNVGVRVTAYASDVHATG